MKQFTSVKELIESLETDKNLKGYYAKYPARIIFFYNNTDYQDFINNSPKFIKNIKLIEITKQFPFIENEDSWQSTSGLRDIIKSTQNSTEDAIIFPLSEMLRFFPDNHFISVISSIFELENINLEQSKRRIYIPFLGQKSRFLNIYWRNYGRKKEWDPLAEVVTQPQKVHLYVPLFRIKENLDNTISTSKELLELWKTSSPPNRIFCHSDAIKNTHLSINDECFEIETLNNFKKYLEKYFLINIPIEYISKEEIFWQQLLEELKKNKVESFRELSENILNIKKIDKMKLLSFWYSQETDLGRWLLKNHYLAFNDNYNSYAHEVIKSICQYDKNSLIKEYWLKIFELDSASQYANERRLGIRDFYSKFSINITFENELEDKIRKLYVNDSSNIEYYLAGIAFCEKKFIIENLESIRNLKDIYPELFYYLDSIELESKHEWINNYFNEYRISKVKNQPSETLSKILENINESKETFYQWYYSFPKVDKFLSKEKVFLVDALGIEFIPLINCLLSEKGFNVKINIARANVPSITELNKIESAETIRDLDELIHSEFYIYPDTLIKEIEIIKKIVEDIAIRYEKFIITSDHGFTAFATKSLKGSKIYDFKNVSHEGRCVFLDNNCQFDDETYFFRHEIEIKGKKMISLIPLTHISISETPRRESHGGATPEEVLIPVIYASKLESEQKEAFQIIPISMEINLREPYFKFRISPETDLMPSVIHQNSKLKTSYVSDEKVYITECKGLKSGKNKIVIKIGNVSQEFIIIIKSGLKERDII